MTVEKECNGWKNRATWNVSLWVNNDESLYLSAVEYVKRCRLRGKKPRWGQFVISAGILGEKTPDGFSYSGTRLDKKALSEMLDELAPAEKVAKPARVSSTTHKTGLGAPREVGQVSWKTFKCSDCGHKEDFSTNHKGEIYGRCGGCSWKGGLGYGPGDRVFEYVEEKYK